MSRNRFLLYMSNARSRIAAVGGGGGGVVPAGAEDGAVAASPWRKCRRTWRWRPGLGCAGGSRAQES